LRDIVSGIPFACGGQNRLPAPRRKRPEKWLPCRNPGPVYRLFCCAPSLIAFRRIRYQTIKGFARAGHAEFIARALLNRFLPAVEVINFSKELIVARF
jgi:hypothetical protein